MTLSPFRNTALLCGVSYGTARPAGSPAGPCGVPIVSGDRGRRNLKPLVTGHISCRGLGRSGVAGVDTRGVPTARPPSRFGPRQGFAETTNPDHADALRGNGVAGAEHGSDPGRSGGRPPEPPPPRRPDRN